MARFYIIRFATLVSVAVLVFGACNRAQEEPVIIITLEPEFSVALYEARDATDGHATFGLWVESVAEYDCAGYQLKSESSISGPEISLRLLDAQRPDTCYGPGAPVSGFLPIGNLPDGAYRLAFTLGSTVENEGELRIANGSYEWTLPSPAGIDLQQRVLKQLPEGLMWGYIRTPAEPDKPLAQTFISELKSISGDDGLEEGYYGYFSIAGTGLPFFHQSFMPEGNAVYFVRRLDGDPTQLRNLLDAYRNDALHPLEIVCLSTMGAF